jgi:hypothetical protein
MICGAFWLKTPDWEAEKKPFKKPAIYKLDDLLIAGNSES